MASSHASQTATDITETQLTDTELKILRLAKFLHFYDAILSVNLVGFITENVWKYVPFPIQAELLSLSYNDLCLLPVSLSAIRQDDENQPSESAGQLSNLRDFMQDVYHNRLENMQVLTALEDICGFKHENSKSSSQSNMHETEPRVMKKMNSFMSEKKSHEVDVMSDVIAAIAKGANIQQVVDIGSGKGYLGQHLTQKHSLNVLGIDSSDTNSHGAKVRGRKMRKQLPGQNRKVPDGCSEKASSLDNEYGSSVKEFKGNSQLKDCECNQDTGIRDSDEPKGTCQCTIVNRISSLKLEDKDEKTGRQNDLSARSDGAPIYKPVTAFVDTYTDVSELLCDSNAQREMLLSGLHTCGDLSSSMLRLFLSNPRVRVVCNVPCCYHLLTEEFDELKQVDQTTTSYEGMKPDVHYGFPMSSCLRLQKTRIGGVAKMIACMAAERLAHEKKLSTEKLFYRAVLQVVLKEHYSIPTRQQRTGKLASKCANFVDYTRKALKKMGYKEDKLSDEVIQQYHDTYKPEMKKLEAFHQLRAALAPSIEALIVLDKLAYLQEQESVKQAYLVCLFNPITSPRCYAVIAAK
ncbi:probable methyltransferase-like protein 25 [Amphiura filiformis]|uniref:probable methyltransferase-like protein 25 n=1 Tax=Amphiura filiformis TaxID=82378 RepID=UPI003B20F3EA